MPLFVLRHGEAGAHLPVPADDERRPLTKRGQKRMRDAAHGMRRLGARPDILYSSPLVRARQTADIVADLFAAPVHETALLSPTDLTGHVQLAPLLTSHQPTDNVYVVGHEPHLSALIGYLISTTPPGSQTHIRLKKGALARIEWRLDTFPSSAEADITSLAGAGELAWLLNAKQLALISG